MGELLHDEKGAGIELGGPDNPISTRKLQRWRQEGAGPAYLKIGQAIRYTQSQLDAYKAACERRSTSEAPAWPIDASETNTKSQAREYVAEQERCPSRDDTARQASTIEAAE